MMTNMSYCRFENTSSDLADCEEHFHDDDLSREEHAARASMVRRMVRILEDLGVDVGDPQEEAPWIFKFEE